MGIHKLMDLIRSNAQDSIRKRDLKYYSGFKVALDASMSMYQFLVSTQGISSDANYLTNLTDSQGNKTGHLLGIFNRTMTLLQNGIKPIWVFDGKPPTKKDGQILRRRKVKQQAIQKKQQAQQVGDLAQALKQQQRTTYITKKEKQDVMKMLQLMGIPVIQAPGQAQAQCSYMSRNKIVDAVCTEDTDSLVFGTQLLIRQLNNKKEPVCQITRQTLLKELDLTQDQFIDMCILCGCDYASKIQGIGPVKAYKLIKQLDCIQNIIQHCQLQNKKNPQKQKFKIPKPEQFDYQEVRSLFKKPNVTDDYELKWQKNIDQQALKKFLISQKQFSEGRVQGAIKKLKTNKGTQPRLQQFFGKPVLVKGSVKVQQKKKSAKKK